MTSENFNEKIRQLLKNKYSVQDALAHRFEYHIFCAGEMHRIGRCTHEDAFPLVGEWVQQQFEKNGSDREMTMFVEKPIHVFLDGKLWTVLTFEKLSSAPALGGGEMFQATFAETSFMFGILDSPIVENEPRCFHWTIGDDT